MIRVAVAVAVVVRVMMLKIKRQRRYPYPGNLSEKRVWSRLHALNYVERGETLTGQSLFGADLRKARRMDGYTASTVSWGRTGRQTCRFEKVTNNESDRNAPLSCAQLPSILDVVLPLKRDDTFISPVSEFPRSVRSQQVERAAPFLRTHAVTYKPQF